MRAQRTKSGKQSRTDIRGAYRLTSLGAVLRRRLRLGERYGSAMSHEQRVIDAGIELPDAYPPAGLYVASVLVGDMLHIGGHGPLSSDGTMVTGKVGASIDLEGAKRAARLTGLQMLTSAKTELGSLDRVVRVVKVFGMVNCAPGFNNTPAVIDGCSALFHEVFGEAGVHTRSAVGMAELPFDICVELEAIFQVAPN